MKIQPSSSDGEILQRHSWADEAVAALFPAAFGLRIERDGDALLVRTNDDSVLLALSSEHDEWTLTAPDGHAHLDAFDEAMNLALALLAGEARFASEYRGETLAAAWIEVWDGEAFEVRHSASYLSPFEADEWELSPGEEWRVVRKTLALGTSEGFQTFERRSDTPSQRPTTMFDWLETALGSPEPGMRWAVVGHGKLVLQIMRGWRRRQDQDVSSNQADFAPPGDGPVLRVRAYFRPSQIEVQDTSRETHRPVFVDYCLESPSATDARWSAHVWEATFTDGANDMLAVIELFFLPAREGVEAMRSTIQTALQSSRYIPGEWSMQPDR